MKSIGLMQKKAVKLGQRNRNDTRRKDTNRKIAGIKLTKQVSTLNVNGPTTSIRK